MSCCNNFIGIFCTDSNPMQTVFGFSSMQNGVLVMKYYDATTNLPYEGEVINSCLGGANSFNGLIENKINITAQNNYSDFQKAHASIRVGNAIILGTRGAVSDSGISRLIIYPNYEDLTTFETFDLTSLGSSVSLESICYVASTNSVYLPISTTKKLLVADITDVPNAQIIDIPLVGMQEFGGSCPIVTDGVHLYLCTENSTAYFYKIHATTFALVASVNWVGSDNGAHSGSINLTNRIAHFVSFGGGQIAKLNIDAMTYTSHKRVITSITDDHAYIPASVYPTNTNLLVMGAESVNHQFGGSIYDLDNNKEYQLPLMRSVCVYWDAVNNLVVSLSMEGFIETLSIADIYDYITTEGVSIREKIQVYPLRTYMPNELIVTDGGAYFITIWERPQGAQDEGNLMGVYLETVENSVITKKEVYEKFYAKKSALKIDIDENLVLNPSYEYVTIIVGDSSVSDGLGNVNIICPTSAQDPTIPLGTSFRIFNPTFNPIQILCSGDIMFPISANFTTTNETITVYKISDTSWVCK